MTHWQLTFIDEADKVIKKIVKTAHSYWEIKHIAHDIWIDLEADFDLGRIHYNVAEVKIEEI